MPTKPSNTTPIFALATNYSVGPKIGQPTKSTDLGAALATEGHVPGKGFPTAANEFNAFLNGSSLLTHWVFLGTDAKDLDAHIVETDSNGSLNVGAINAGGVGSAFRALTVANNVSGNAMRVTSTDATSSAVRIDSNNTTTTSATSLEITNNRTGIEGHMVVAETDGGPDSLGGVSIECSTDRNLGSTGIQMREQSAVNALNSEGVAVEAVGNSQSLAAMTALNVAAAGVSIRAGFGNEDSSPSNAGGNAIESRGGDGDSSAGIDGGDGINARGGDAVDGTFDVAGGPGVFAKGGASATEPGGPGVYSESTGNNSVSLVVEHGTASSFADLAQFNTGDNTANGIVVSCEGFGNAIRAEGQGGSGLHITQTPEGVGGVIFPHISMIPQEAPSIGPDATGPGDMWAEDNPTGPNNLKYNPGGQRQYIPRTTQPWCAASRFITTATSVANSTLINIMTISFASEQQPDAQTIVNIRAMGSINTDAVATPVVGLALYDDTAAIQLVSKTVSMAAGVNVKDVHIVYQYTVPTGGGRTFSLRYNLPATSDGAFNQALNWLCEITAAPE